MEKVLFLDFDGVLFDTIKEVYLVNRYISCGVDYFQEINQKEYEKYSHFKYLIYNIWMFYYYNPLIFKGSYDIVSDFENAIKTRDLKKEEEYCSNFLNLRKELILNHYDFWEKLETPYNFFFEIKKLYENGFKDIVIVTKKNKSSVIKRFKTYDFNFGENKIFARDVLDNYPSKADFMDEYMKKNNYQKAFFVDDNYNNIYPCEKYENIKTALALWGNANPNYNGVSEDVAIEKIKEFLKSTNS